jgi:hypothetical protein
MTVGEKRDPFYLKIYSGWWFKELKVLSSMKPTKYTYHTLLEKVEKALGTVGVSLRIGPIVVFTWIWWLCRLVVVTTCFWAMN